ncbi:putative fatty-acid-CoA ligase FadD [Gordonia spumicola]|uniref:Putative fatty-acid-CoA ligase FadD n=1 Tax=Gordonia spumicola TaxID=589161 RepID=A0A7I9VFC1_9ACTN|nr:AMP-binding protein [Gordonia spumicola]GEE04015.1 putative fatty-acid-CoA ligase FadD [Gordonia spumicola]
MLDATLTTADLLRARRDDTAPALRFADQTWTWAEFVVECERRAAALAAVRADLPPETPWHIGALMDNSPEYMFLIGGAALSGATLVGVNPTRRGDELISDVTRTDCAIVLVGPSMVELATDLDGAVRTLRTDSDEYRALLRAEPTILPEGPDNHTLLLLFTSGSTGAPKAVKCSSARLAAIGALNVHGITRDDVAYNAMPLFHGNAVMSAWAPILFVGGAYALRDKFSASGFLPDIQRFGATFFNYVGRSLAYILAQPERPEERDNSLRFGWGTEASPRDRDEFARRFGVPVVESYGSSEGVCVIVRDASTPRGALGIPNPALGMVVLDESGAECPPAIIADDGGIVNGDEAIGEIVARGGGNRFEGYYNNDAAAAEKIRDGDYWSGDLAYRTPDGVYWFAGRTNDWIRVDSENFSTAPLERIITRYPSITGASAYGVPDPRTGDRVMATLETDDSFDATAFAEFLDAQLDMGTKWTPHFLRLTRRFPLTATRKIDKASLRRAAWRSDDRILVRDGDRYVPFDADSLAAFEASFADHDRSHLLPADPREKDAS